MLSDDLRNIVRGEVYSDNPTLSNYAHDTSLFNVMPQVVVAPRDVEDVKALVRYVNEHRSENKTLSLTGRSAGTDMTGGPLNESIILDFTKHFDKATLDEDHLVATVEPGVYYRDFEKIILPDHLTMPAYPASKQLAALGGMIMNNSAGEETLRYGQMRRYANELSMVLSDGNEYTFRKLSRTELDNKLKQEDFEGNIYRKLFRLFDDNYDLIKSAKPKTAKNSAGYDLWDVWDRDKQTFDLSELFVGSQGTLGLLTKAQLNVLHAKPEKRLLVVFFKNWKQLPNVVNAILPFEPGSLEAFDDATLKLGIRFMPEIARKAHSSLLAFAWQFLPEFWIGVQMLGLPKLIVLIELAESTNEAIERKTDEIEHALEPFNVHVRTIRDAKDAEKYWTMRRESFNLLRQHVDDKRTAPFIEDFCVRPELVPEFLPKAIKLLKDHGIQANITGHAGEGNFHIIPLMDLRKKSEREKIPVVAEKFYDLVLKYGGTITAEHNDGIMRTPFLEKMYGPEVYALFKEIKHILDPDNIFNPGKKVATGTIGTVEYIKTHISPK